jgi:hypothetical protein
MAITDVEDACRFCFEGPDTGNPLVTPCKCIGSMKYVHIQCIKKWRETTSNHEWVHRCQLCLEDYDVFLRWEKEDAPHQVPLLHALTKKPAIVSIIFYYFHLIFLSLVPISMILNYSTELLTIYAIQIHQVKPPYANFHYLYFTRISYYIYLSMLSAVTGLYFSIYYRSFWKYIHNKQLYAYLWLSCVSDSGIFQSPLMTIVMLIGSGMFTSAFISPFGFLYIYMLSSIYNIHITIIQRINDTAEIF